MRARLLWFEDRQQFLEQKAEVMAEKEDWADAELLSVLLEEWPDARASMDPGYIVLIDQQGDVVCEYYRKD